MMSKISSQLSALKAKSVAESKVMKLCAISVLFLPLAFLGVGAGDQARCKDENRKNVDWFIMYKVPKMQRRGNANFITPDGQEFAYVDANTPSSNKVWKLSSENIYDENNPLAYTLAPLYKSQRKPTNLLYAVYNDQPPNSHNGTRNGHTKGVVMFDDTTGIWLQHSVPRFMEELFTGKFTFPENARENGQAILCVTFPTSQLNTIAKHLRMQYANIYESGSPEALRRLHPQVDLLFKGSFIRGPKQKLSADIITSAGGKKFVSIAKRATMQVDIYSEIITNVTQDDILVQSWRNGAGKKLDASCRTQYIVLDADAVNLSFGKNSLSWSSREDHSKWAVGIRKPWFCFGSLNRMESQFNRGGEVMCTQDAMLSSLFRRTGSTKETC
ncbi:plancitoxin-1-like isoform X2 [Ornithodoros turicata]|uniref:plancitoxin-1-like isoform X2 n=1 Tax=Ornithodoros turicata TaxID=34597 RepID=UPI00313A19F4